MLYSEAATWLSTTEASASRKCRESATTATGRTATAKATEVRCWFLADIQQQLKQGTTALRPRLEVIGT